MSKPLCASLLLLCSCSTAAADGLVFDLPEDRTAAVFEMEMILQQDGRKFIERGSVLLAPVGRAEVAGVKLRWLEIAIDAAEDNNKAYRMIYKVLIPEKFLQQGGSPAECVLKCWWTRKFAPGTPNAPRPELLDKHPHDERWGLLPTLILTGAMTEKKKLAAVEMDTMFGKSSCVGVAGRFDYEQESRKWQTKIETRLHPKAPFGVISSQISIQIERDGQKLTGSATFKLAQVLRNYDGELKAYQ